MSASPLPSIRYPELETKPDLPRAMERVLAWFEGQVIDRAPVRFSSHNAEYNRPGHTAGHWASLQERWFDAVYQVDSYIDSLAGQSFLAESIPVFWPNLGPEVYAAFHGSEVVFQDVTSYTVPLVHTWDDTARIRFDPNNVYLRKIDEITELALERCAGKCLVGYTDLHGGIDCAADRGETHRSCAWTC